MEKVVFLWALAAGCDLYTCDDPDIVVEAGTCAYLYPDESTWYLSACDAGYECGPTNVPSNFTCQRQSPVVIEPAYPGEPCNYDSDCQYSVKYKYGCVKGVCTGQLQGGLCVDSSECEPGLYCYSASCTQLSAAKQSCTQDTDCVQTCGCDILPNALKGTCIPYFSLQANSTISACPGPVPPYTTILSLPTGNNVNYLCESGSCITSEDTQVSTCVNPLTSATAIPVNCTNNDGVCLAGNALGVAGKCAGCGMNPTGSSFCPLFSGDGVFPDFVAQTASWFSSKYPQTCNTHRRLDCMATVWSLSSYQKWLYYSLATWYYPKLATADDCTVQVLLPDFYPLYKQFNGGVNAALAAFFVLLIVL